MDRVKSQAAVVSQLLFDPKTADAYKNVFVLTGTIIKDVALLAWLLICSVFVLVAWIGDTAMNTGQEARQWWQTQQTQISDDVPVDGNQAAAATGKALLDISQNGANFLLDKARSQLGLEQLERPAKVEAAPAKPASAPAAKPASAPAAKSASAPAATSVSASAASAASAAKDVAANVVKEVKDVSDDAVS